MGYYFLIGLIYTFINGFVRKIDTEGDFYCLWFGYVYGLYVL